MLTRPASPDQDERQNYASFVGGKHVQDTRDGLLYVLGGQDIFFIGTSFLFCFSAVCRFTQSHYQPESHLLDLDSLSKTADDR